MVLGRSCSSQNRNLRLYVCHGRSAADITHPPPGKPSFPSLVGSIDENAVRYVFRMSRHPPHYFLICLHRTGGIQSLSHHLCHIYTRSTRTVSIPAPVYCKHQFSLSHLCADNSYTQAGHNLSTAASDVVSTALSQVASGAGDEGSWVTGFQQTHEQMTSRTYFC